MPKGFTESEREYLRKMLIDKAGQLFSTYGLKKTNVEEIARAVGISKGAFYLFFPSKEILFMHVLEEMEERFRSEILSAIPTPGESEHTRLASLLKHAFALFDRLPLLQILSGIDYITIFRAVSPDLLKEHLTSDHEFIRILIQTCQENNIQIRLSPEEFLGLLYPLVLAKIHAGEFPQVDIGRNIHTHLELVAGYALGEFSPHNHLYT
jgi:AcrR family transcriptional regulator